MHQGTCKSPTLFNFFTSKFPRSDNIFTNSYAGDFSVSCFNSNVDQITEALTDHSSNIKGWADERGLAISSPKCTITVFTHQFEQSCTHPQVTLNNSLLPFGRTPRILRVTFCSLSGPFLCIQLPFGSPTPHQSPSLIQKLQNIQYSALRIATGSFEITFIDHLYEELKCFLSKITFP